MGSQGWAGASKAMAAAAEEEAEAAAAASRAQDAGGSLRRSSDSPYTGPRGGGQTQWAVTRRGGVTITRSHSRQTRGHVCGAHAFGRTCCARERTRHGGLGSPSTRPSGLLEFNWLMATLQDQAVGPFLRRQVGRCSAGGPRGPQRSAGGRVRGRGRERLAWGSCNGLGAAAAPPGRYYRHVVWRVAAWGQADGVWAVGGYDGQGMGGVAS